jgi:hypothetical protein
MSNPLPSQVSLMRVKSNQPKCWVFVEAEEKL